MKRIFRLLYPIGIYIGITYLISIVFLICITIITMAHSYLATGWAFSAKVLSSQVMNTYMGSVLLITAVSAAASAPLLYWFFKKDQEMRGIYPAFELKIPEYSGYLLVLGISACLAGNNLLTISGISRLFPGYDSVAHTIYGNSLWFQAVSVGFIVPLTEEFTFRALGFRRLRDSMSFEKAAVLSALCFGIFHGNVVQGIYAFALGYLMAYVYEKYQTFLAPVIFHCIANLTSVLISSTPFGKLLYLNGAAVILVTVISVWAVCYSMKKIQFYYKKTEVEEL